MTKIKVIRRIRAKIKGTDVRPRLAVSISLKHVYAQLIDDVKGVTLVSVSDKEIKDMKDISEIGKLIAKKASDKKITTAVFDRRGKKFHGNIKKVADGAREGGLKI